jgi:hypothetical protein
MAIQVIRESLDTKARHVSPAYIDKDGVHYLTSSDKPFPTVDVNHLRLHEGRAYYVYRVESSLAVNGNLDIAVAWPSGIYPHAVFNYQCGGDSRFYVYEDPTTSGGTALTIHRRNRALATTSTGAAVYAPTVSATGTEIFAEIITSGQGGTGAGGGGYTYEYVLKPLTTYLFRLTNINSQAHIAELLIEWYE